RAGPAGTVGARRACDRDAGCVARAGLGPRRPVRRTLAVLRRGEARGDGLLRALSDSATPPLFTSVRGPVHAVFSARGPRSRPTRPPRAVFFVPAIDGVSR